MSHPTPTIALSVVGGQPGRCVAAASFAGWLASTRGVSPFLCPAQLSGGSLLRTATGKAPRHLDPWLMNAQQVRAALASQCSAGDWPLLVGAGPPLASSPAEEGAEGGLAELANWLGALQIGVLAEGDLSALPARPPAAFQAVLLDEVSSHDAGRRWKLEIEARWGLPVLGWSRSGKGVWAGEELADAWDSVCDHRAWARLEAAAPSRMWRVAERPITHPSGSRIAIAAGGASLYFPETLDLLQQAGAELCEFSLCGCDRLPDEVDLVYLGPGLSPADLAKAASNHCLKQSLRAYAALGGRIFAEGAGSALLCREAIRGGVTHSLAGILPVRARWEDAGECGAQSPPAVQFAFGLSSWLADRGERWRGRQDASFRFEPCGGLLTYSHNPEQRLEMLGRHNVIASRVYFHAPSNRALAQRLLTACEPVGVALGR